MADVNKETDRGGKGTGSKETSRVILTAGRTPRRVKVYLLDGDDWLDEGTGYCIGDIEDETNRPFFIVRNESNSEEVLLKSFLEGSTQYQRQQETLIVWTDPRGKDLALSFQETEGCADLCEFIIRVQQENYSPQISLYYVILGAVEGDDTSNAGNDITELITGPVTYPDTPTCNNLNSVLDIVSQASHSQFTRSNMLNFLIKEDYLSKLINLFERAEQSRLLEDLYALSDIIKCLILYNDTNLIDDFVSSEDRIFGLAGILEYSREHPKLKTTYRDFIKDGSKFKTVVDIPSSSYIRIFKRDFHLNYLKDVVLARFLDDQALNIFSSLIYLNQVEIINFLKDSSINDNFLDKLFTLYDSDDKIEAKREGVKMIHQYALIAKSLQTFQSDFFSALISKGLFSMIKFALEDTDNTTRVLGTEVIVIIIEQDVSLINSIDSEAPVSESDTLPGSNNDSSNPHEHNHSTIIKLRLSNDMTLIRILTKLLIKDKNLGLKIQVFEALKILLDSNISVSSNSGSTSLQYDTFRELNSSKQIIMRFRNGDEFQEQSNEVNTQYYFKAFYSEVAPDCFASLISLAQSDEIGIDLLERIQSDQLLQQLLCGLVSFCARDHETQIARPFILHNHILLGVARLLGIQVSPTLKLSALRCIKSILLLNDSFYCRYIINNGLFEYFFSFFRSVVAENNLMSSACLDLLEIIIQCANAKLNFGKRHNFKLLARHIYKNYKPFLLNELMPLSTRNNLLKLLENDFYDAANENDGNEPTKKGLFDSEDEPTSPPRASTPIQVHQETTSSEPDPQSYRETKPANLFEDIENALIVNAYASKDAHMPSEESSCDFSVAQAAKTDDELKKRKIRLSTKHMKKKLSNASKRLASGFKMTDSDSNKHNFLMDS